MRLIDADELKNAIVEEGQRSKRYKIGEFWELNREEIWKVIDEMPTVQPEIIRCKDCKYWRDDHTCHEHSLVSPMRANEYCSRAERRVERGNDGHID